MTKQCNWTENKLINGKLVTVNCENINTVHDKDNVNERWFCIDKDNHIEEVKKTRKIMHKNCINKNKLLDHIKKINEECFGELRTKTVQKDISYWNGAWNIIIELKRYIENGEFE